MTSPRNLLTAWQIQAKKQLGQNFISDPSITQKIVTRADIQNDDSVVEIGPGLGALTIPIAAKAKAVHAIETDSRVIPLLKAELAVQDLENVTIHKADFLRFDMNPLLKEIPAPRILMGNLPYNISSQILIRVMEVRQFFTKAVFMFQKELAERISAPPGNRDYGRLSVMLQYCADVKFLTNIPANCFFPKPTVDSTVIEIKFHHPPKYQASDEPFFFNVIKAAFGKRRKTLKNALSQSDLGIDASMAENALLSADIDPKTRAEALSVAQFLELSNQIKALQPASLSESLT